MSNSNTLKFSESGVRGIVGEGLTPQLVTELGTAFGFYQGGGRIVVGRDTRSTGAMFEDALIAGLLSAGCQVVKLGIVPTPTIQFMVNQIGASGGVAITASHNPSQWNALKFIGGRGTFLDRGEATELFDLYCQGSLPCRQEKDLREVRQLNGAFDKHMERILSVVDTKVIQKRHFRVAVDCANGVGALFSEIFLKQLGCEVFAINTQLDGFRRPPEPLPENLYELSQLVKSKRCDVGFGQDPDGDRLTLVTNLGQAMNPHYTVALAIEQVLEGGDPGPVVVNMQTSRLLEYICHNYGCELLYSKVGEINVVEKMIEVDSEIGGEGNCGGVIYRSVHPGRDSFTAMSLILERLALTTESLADIIVGYPSTCNLSARFVASPIIAREVLASLQRNYTQYHPLIFDGLRFDLPEGRILMRSSNTEPIIRLNIETEYMPTAEALLARFSAEIEQELAIRR